MQTRDAGLSGMNSMHARCAAHLECQPMQATHLDAVSAIETAVHACPWTRGNFADCLTADYAAWVLWCDGELAGYAVMSQALDETELLDIGIAAAQQRAGLGRYLMDFLLNEARRHGSIRMLLEVRESNQAARELYERCGFIQVGVRHAYYPVKNGREAALILAMNL